jgi:hypothetical protein
VSIKDAIEPQAKFSATRSVFMARDTQSQRFGYTNSKIKKRKTSTERMA